MDVDAITTAIGSLWSNKLNLKQRPQIIIETGTGDGLGTTQWLIQGFKKSQASYANRPKLITIEVNENKLRQAMDNLKGEPWITVFHGCSVDHNEAYNWMLTDEMIKNKDKYPNLKIDSDNPISFYYKEITAKLSLWGMTDSGETNMLTKLCDKYKGHRPLFLLDGAGGIGYLEFQKVIEGMGDKRFYVLVKDIDHIKHYRTYQHILANENGRWSILASDHTEWVLAECSAKKKK